MRLGRAAEPITGPATPPEHPITHPEGIDMTETVGIAGAGVAGKAVARFFPTPGRNVVISNRGHHDRPETGVPAMSPAPGRAVKRTATAGRRDGRPGRFQVRRKRPAVIDPRRDLMHPMFKELFIHTDADDLLAEEDRQRRARRIRRARPALVVTPAAGNRQQRSRA
jgi:hypothetical protein